MGMIEWGQKSKPKKILGLPTKPKKSPGPKINPLKNTMPNFQALKISKMVAASKIFKVLGRTHPEVSFNRRREIFSIKPLKLIKNLS